MRYIVDTANLKPYVESTAYKTDFTGKIFPGYHFTWEEVTAGNGKKYITHELLEQHQNNIIFMAILLEDYRSRIGQSINIECWLRETHYNNVVLPSQGYKSSTKSDHLEGRAADTNVRPTAENIRLWKQVCRDHNVFWSYGNYGTWMHLGFRFDRNHSW